MCQGNCVPLKRLAIYSSLIVGTAGRVKSNVVSYFTVLPSLCSLFLRLLLYRKWSYQCWLNISWKFLLDQIFFKYFALFTVVLWALA